MTGPGDDPEAELQHSADELEHHLEALDAHISDAQKTAAARREEANPEAVAGDWEETRGAPGQGEDPQGAVPDTDEDGATERDATASDDAEASGGGSGRGESSGSGESGERDDPAGSRMPGHASGGDD
jgi:hypothetical protein